MSMLFMLILNEKMTMFMQHQGAYGLNREIK